MLVSCREMQFIALVAPLPRHMQAAREVDSRAYTKGLRAIATVAAVTNVCVRVTAQTSVSAVATFAEEADPQPRRRWAC